jgi:hypothetical protein
MGLSAVDQEAASISLGMKILYSGASNENTIDGWRLFLGFGERQGYVEINSSSLQLFSLSSPSPHPFCCSCRVSSQKLPSHHSFPPSFDSQGALADRPPTFTDKQRATARSSPRPATAPPIKINRS